MCHCCGTEIETFGDTIMSSEVYGNDRSLITIVSFQLAEYPSADHSPSGSELL